MQQAEKELASDDVVFLYVNTMEKASAETVKAFLDEKEYDFHTLLDRPKRGEQGIAKNYGVSGIPTKFIIDQQGDIRFEEVGFTGSNEQLANKMKVQIQLLQGINSSAQS
jgi:peroxiredoxin